MQRRACGSGTSPGPKGFVLLLLIVATFCASASAFRTADFVSGRAAELAGEQPLARGVHGGRQLRQSTASASGTGGNVSTSTQTTAGGQTTTSGENLQAPPGGTVTSSVSSSAPNGSGSPAPSSPPPPPPNCTDIPPPLNGYSCAQQAGWGKCKETWMIQNGWCKRTCGVCPYPPPPPPAAPILPPLFPPIGFPPIVFPPILPPIINPSSPSSPCVSSQQDSGSNSASASAHCP